MHSYYCLLFSENFASGGEYVVSVQLNYMDDWAGKGRRYDLNFNCIKEKRQQDQWSSIGCKMRIMGEMCTELESLK